MTDTEAQPVSLVETPHALDSIKPDAWVNIPRCITDAFQLIVSQIKSTQNQMLTINETVTKSHEQLETEFKSFVQASNISEREIAKLIDGFRDTLNRTLKNFSLEVSVISEMALENQQKVQQLQEQTKSLKKGLGSLEDNGLQKIIKDITDELSLKFDIKEANLKDYVGNKIYEMIDIPGLVGPGKKFNNIKSLIKHIHDAYDSRADAITQVIDNRDAFLKKALTDYDLPSKIKTVVHTEIRQHVMPEIEKMDMTLTKYEDKQKQSINESALLARIQSLEQQSKALEDKLHRMQILHEGFAMSPRVVEQTEENKETIGSKDSIVDVEVRIRSKSDSREMSRGLNFDAHSKNKLSRNVLWKDESGSRLIEEEDEDVMSPQVKGHKAIGFDQDLELEKRTSEATEKGKESQLVSDILKEKSAPINDTGSMYSSNVSSSSHGGKSPMRAIKPSLVQKGKPKRSNTITLESNNNTKTHFKSTKATDESFTTEGNTSLRKDGSPHRAHILDQSSMMSKTGHSFGGKAQIFDPAKFDIKQMGPHTFEFLSILEHEFDAIYNLLGDLYHQHDHNKTPTHLNHRQTTARSGAGPSTGRGTSMDNRELPPPKVSPPKSTSAKVSAYQLLKALTKHGEEHAPPKEKGPSQQEILSRPPLIQIRPQGVQVAAVQPPSQGQSHLPQLPQRARIASDQLAHDAKELMEAHGHGRMSPLKMRATQGNGKWGVGMAQAVQGGIKDVSRLTGDSSFEMTKEILDNEREDGVFVPYPTEKTMQEIPIVRQRAVTDKFSRDNGERMYS